MRSRLRRARAATALGAAALSAAAGLMSATPARGSTDAGDGGVLVSAPGSSTMDDRLTPLAGSPTTLVYGRTHWWLNGGYERAGYTPAWMDVVARTADGSERHIATVDPADYRLWSLVGTTLTAYSYRAGHMGIAWWDLATLDHGMIAGDPQRYAAAGPRGALVLTRDSELVLRRFDGTTVSYGRGEGLPPSPSWPDGGLSWAVPGEDGVVVGRGNDLGYIRWDAPGQLVLLQGPGTGRNLVHCSAPGTTYVACSAYGDGGAWPMVVPLDGSPSTSPAAAESRTIASPVISGDTAVYVERADVRTAGLGSYTARTETAEHSDRPVDPIDPVVDERTLVGAYGEAVTATPELTTLLAATDAQHVSSLVEARPSPATVGWYGLAADHVVWVDDTPDPGDATVVATVWSRTVEWSDGQLSLGDPVRLQGVRSIPEYGVQVVAGQHTTAYNGGGALHVQTPGGDRTFPGPVHYLVAVSDRWALYQDDDALLHALDVATGADHLLAGHTSEAALDGSILVWVPRSGLWTADVDRAVAGTASPRRLARKPAEGSALSGVSVSGNWAGWNGPGTDGPRAHLRNRRTLAPALVLRHRALIQLTPHGALLSRGTADPHPLWFRPRSHGTWGEARVVLPSGTYGWVQLAGRAVTWLSRDGQLRATPFG